MVLLAGAAWGQVTAPSITLVSSAPSGACSINLPDQQVITTGTLYSCQNGTWAQIGSGGGGSGTVTSVTGTANQIDVATGTTTPVISIDPVLQLPGTLAGSSATFTGTMSAASYASSPAGGVGGGLAGPEGTVPATIGEITIPQAAYDGCYFDSTLHGEKCSWNNASFLPIPLLTGTMTSGHAVSVNATTNLLQDAGFLSSNIVRKDTTNAGTAAMTLDISASTVGDAFKVPVVAGFAAGASGSVGFNSTTNNYKVYANGADAIVGAFSTAPTNNHCVKATVAGGNVILADSGGACGGSGNTYNGSGITVYSGSALTITGTQYIPFGGGAIPSSTEANVQTKIGVVATIANLCASIPALAGGGNVVFTLRANGGAVGTPGNVTVTVNSSTGVCDTTNSYTTSANDLLDLSMVTTGTVGAALNLQVDAQVGTGGITGSGTNSQLAYWNGSTGLGSMADFTFSGHTISMGTGGLLNLTAATGSDTFRTQVKSGFTSGATGSFGEDSATGSYHAYIAGADAILAGFASAPAGSKLVQTSGTTGLQVETTALPNNTTTNTQTAGDNSTKVATTAYADQTGFPIYNTAQTGVSMTSGTGTITGICSSGVCTMASSGLTAGTYKLQVQIVQTTTGNGGTCTTGTVKFEYGYKDADTGVTYSNTSGGILLFGTISGLTLTQNVVMTNGGNSGATNFVSYPISFRAATGVAITYTIQQTAASNCTTPPVFAVRPSLYYLGF
jgi:hypothetical protein